jgi:hypothetical protein
VVDTTAVLYGHIISSNSRSPLSAVIHVGNSEQWATKMLLRRPSFALRHHSIDVLLGIKHGLVSGHHSLSLLLGIARGTLHLKLCKSPGQK